MKTRHSPITIVRLDSSVWPNGVVYQAFTYCLHDDPDLREGHYGNGATAVEALEELEASMKQSTMHEDSHEESNN